MEIDDLELAVTWKNTFSSSGTMMNCKICVYFLLMVCNQIPHNTTRWGNMFYLIVTLICLNNKYSIFTKVLMCILSWGTNKEQCVVSQIIIMGNDKY